MIVAGVLAAATSAGGQGWLNSYDKAAALAKKTDRLILADFTGSDWCGWCIKLKKEVFNTPTFQKWASENVVLLEVDFPSRKAQPAALKKQNQDLAQKFGIKGYPTIVFFNAKGKQLGRSGYRAGGPTPWIQNAQSIIGKRKSTAIKPAFKNLTIEKSLTSALENAKENGQALFIAVSGTSKLAQKNVRDLFADEQFINMAAGAATIVHVEVDSVSADKVALKALRKEYKLSNASSQYALLDIKQGKKLYSLNSAVKPAVVVPKLKSVMPKAPPAPKITGWTEDFPTAMLAANEGKKHMILDFTGSDWCHWCVKLDEEIFEKPQFKDYAAKNLVLVKLDFPRRKQQDAKIKAQNMDLMKRYGVRGFPTLIILDPNGKHVGTMGYVRGGPQAFLKELGDITKSK